MREAYIANQDAGSSALQNLEIPCPQIPYRAVVEVIFAKGPTETAKLALDDLKQLYTSVISSIAHFTAQDRSGTFFHPDRVQSTIGVLLSGDTPESNALVQQAGRFGVLLGINHLHRRFFVAKNGYFGLGPASMAEGDEIWLLKGNPIPFVLRRARVNSFQLIGEAYVHGIMHGEAATEEGNIVFEEIQLC